MKLNKFFMLGMAGLAFAACSNEEEAIVNGPQGNGALEIKFSNGGLFTKTVAGTDESVTDGEDKVLVEGTVTVNVTAGGTGTKTATITTEEIAAGKTVKFWDITNPTKVEAYINDGKESYAEISITNNSAPNMQAMPKAIPAYGKAEGANEIKLDGTTQVNNGKEYEMYKATINLEIPVARLEVSGITHVDNEGEDCEYDELTIDGIYLDKIKPTGNGAALDYHYPAIEANEETGTEAVPAPILWESISSESFLSANTVWPKEEGQVYAFNFYPDANQMPILKIYFANATGSEASPDIKKEPRYAVVKSYNQNENFEFKAGTIYRITSIQLKDGNILGTEEGNDMYGLDVTVVEAKWDVETLSAEWVEQ